MGEPPAPLLQTALKACRTAFIGTALFSCVINILMLTGAFFMLQVYDRVLPSRSIPTLVALSVLVAGLFGALGLLDIIRSRILLRISASLDEAISVPTYRAIVSLPLVSKSQGDGLQPLRDLDALRSFLAGQGPTALFDLPWIPIYLLIIFAFHPLLGLVALVGAGLLVCLTVLTEKYSQAPMKEVSRSALARNALADASQRNAEVLNSMGMVGPMQARWSAANSRYMEGNRKTTDIINGFGATSRMLRMMLQSAVLGVGAFFAIHGEATAGIIIAGAILVSRALAPIDLAIANWRGFVAARQSWHRLNALLQATLQRRTALDLPVPSRKLSVEHATAAVPGDQKIILQDISFSLDGGHALGVIGPSASGKSSLARLLVGAWKPLRGAVRLDGSTLDQWEAQELGKHVGYLPQDVELFAGTIAENISRFEPDTPADAVLSAARAAGVHDMVARMPAGYSTEIGEQGAALSAGQRQRIALARALYRDPFLVVLDEPNSNLDSDGELALTQAILGVRARGGIVVVVAHRKSALASVDMLLALSEGRVVAYGMKEEVMAKVLRPPAAQLKVVPSSPGSP